MNQLHQFLDAQDILLDIEVTSKKRALERAALMFENNNGIARSAVFAGLLDRERLGSTALGHGLAVPHTRVSWLKKPLIGILRFKNSIRCETPDNIPIRLMIVLLTPEHETQRHLELLADIANIMSNETLRERLWSSQTPQEMYEVFVPSC